MGDGEESERVYITFRSALGGRMNVIENVIRCIMEIQRSAALQKKCGKTTRNRSRRVNSQLNAIQPIARDRSAVKTYVTPAERRLIFQSVSLSRGRVITDGILLLSNRMTLK